ncbi:hypothetical protein CLV43_111120 [Umezawaea tangerina]|uniref:Uncharacterized protein n=1 Tax=Umezawaea tangerina TaxID=84725 RepID=A0A2T0STM6_9PSEU|nr:hypothetical protein CLV43_111120 [Umezawaea tangerina]
MEMTLVLTSKFVVRLCCCSLVIGFIAGVLL